MPWRRETRTACHRGARSECDQPWDKSRTPLSDAGGAPIVRAMNCGAFAERVVVSPSQCAVIRASMGFDVAALVWVAPPEDDDDKWAIVPRFFVPADNIKKRDSQRELTTPEVDDETQEEISNQNRC